MYIAKILQSPDLFNLLAYQENILRFIPNFHRLIRPYIRLAAIDRDRKIRADLLYWSKHNICNVDGRIINVISPQIIGGKSDRLFAQEDFIG
jgi:hypothetical protein